MNMTIKNVTIGDKFKMPNRKHGVYEVVDFIEQKSLATGNIIGYLCIAKGIDTLATNTFDVPFSTVAINRLD